MNLKIARFLIALGFYLTLVLPAILFLIASWEWFNDDEEELDSFEVYFGWSRDGLFFKDPID